MAAETVSHEVFPIANPDKPQAACVLVLDTSRSMRGDKIRGLEAGVKAYKEYLTKDPMAKDIVETCVITFNNDAQVVHSFSNVEEMPEIALEAKGWTAMGAAIDMAIQQIEDRKNHYKEEGVDYYRPFLVLITDGGPTDMKGGKLDEYAKRLQDGARSKKYVPLVFGTKNADFDVMGPLGFNYQVQYDEPNTRVLLSVTAGDPFLTWNGAATATPKNHHQRPASAAGHASKIAAVASPRG